MILKFKIKEQTLTRICDTKISDKSTDYYKCQFYFDRKTWEGLDLYAVFLNNIGYSTIVPLGKYADILSCTLPKRVMSGKYFSIYVYAKNSYQTNKLSITLEKNKNSKIANQTKALKDILLKIDKKIDNIIFEDNQLKCYSEGKLIDAIYIDNVDDIHLSELIQDHLSDFQEEILTELEKCIKEDDISFEDGVIYFK